MTSTKLDSSLVSTPSPDSPRALITPCFLWTQKNSNGYLHNKKISLIRRQFIKYNTILSFLEWVTTLGENLAASDYTYYALNFLCLLFETRWLPFLPQVELTSATYPKGLLSIFLMQKEVRAQNLYS